MKKLNFKLKLILPKFKIIIKLILFLKHKTKFEILRFVFEILILFFF